jgi:hypothetical protein
LAAALGLIDRSGSSTSPTCKPASSAARNPDHAAVCTITEHGHGVAASNPRSHQRSETCWDRQPRPATCQLSLARQLHLIRGVGHEPVISHSLRKQLRTTIMMPHRCRRLTGLSELAHPIGNVGTADFVDGSVGECRGNRQLGGAVTVAFANRARVDIDSLTPAQIEEKLTRHGFDTSVFMRDGKVDFTYTTTRDIIRLLNEDFFVVDISDDQYAAGSKRRMNTSG